jgi:hypothetical protein
MKLTTLGDVRDLVDKHLPERYRRKPTWRHVSTEIAKTAAGETDLLEKLPQLLCCATRRGATTRSNEDRSAAKARRRSSDSQHATERLI